MQKLRAEKGITLIALVITIIVMLILVGVSVTVALNGGLFSTAQKATGDTKAERDNELALSDGKVTINGQEYNSIDEYVNGGSSDEPTEPENPTGYAAYSVGDEVTIGTENFYVLKDSDATQEKVTLLAKYNLNRAGTAQLNATSSETCCEFSSTNYWYNEETDSYEIDLNSLEVPEGVTSVITTAKTYGANLGGKGRLMTYREAYELESVNKGILYGTSFDATDGLLEFWTGEADGETWPCAVSGSNLDIVTHAPYSTDDLFGVRPVIEISKSLIS